jgi:hypothetical protein
MDITAFGFQADLRKNFGIFPFDTQAIFVFSSSTVLYFLSAISVLNSLPIGSLSSLKYTPTLSVILQACNAESIVFRNSNALGCT